MKRGLFTLTDKLFKATNVLFEYADKLFTWSDGFVQVPKTLAKTSYAVFSTAKRLWKASYYTVSQIGAFTSRRIYFVDLFPPAVILQGPS